MKTKKKLHGPALKGDLATVRDLVAQGADVNEKDAYGITPIYKAFCSGNEELIEYLISEGADINYSMKNDGFPDCYSHAVNAKDLKWIKRFLQNGMDPNAQDHEGSNVLYLLMSNQIYDLDIHEFFLKAGCNPETKSYYDESAADVLNTCGIKELNELYLKYHKNLRLNSEVADIRNNYGPPILFETIENGTSKELRQLIKQNPGIELNKFDMGGVTALSNAIILEKKESAKVLLENGADPSIRHLYYEDYPLPLKLAQDLVNRGVTKFQEIVDLIKAKQDISNENPPEHKARKSWWQFW